MVYDSTVDDNIISDGSDSTENPIIPKDSFCSCIMDTLKGDWIWIKRYGGLFGIAVDNEFKSVIKILSQNEDASINYEVFVEDTLFYKGSCQIQYAQWAWDARGIVNMKLPHWIPSDNWAIYFVDRRNEIPDKNILRFWDSGVDGYDYIYKRIN